MSGVAAWLTGIAPGRTRVSSSRVVYRPAHWLAWCRPRSARAAGALDTTVGDGNILEPTAMQRRADIVCDLVKERLHEAPADDAGLPSQRGPRPSPRAWALSTRLLVGIQW